MLLYTKILQEDGGPVRKVYGTLNNIPAESDKEVTLMDAEGTEFEAVANDTYLDDGHGGIIRASDNKAVNVIVGGVAVIGEKVEAEEEPEEPVEEPIEPGEDEQEPAAEEEQEEPAEEVTE